MKEKKLKVETPHDRLKVLRERLGKTQAEFYAITGVTITTQSTPGELSRKTIEKVLSTTGVNKEWFVDGIGEMKITPVAKVESNTGFCKSIKMHTTAYPQIKNNTIHVAMNKAYELGVKHGVSMNWLFFEIGPMYMESDDWKQDIRKTIKKLESLL